VDGNAVNNTSSQNKRSNILLGLFNSRTGLSLIGLSYDIYQDNRNEIFVGGGTAIITLTGSIGWKHYLFDSSKNNMFNRFYSSPFLVVSNQVIAHAYSSNEVGNVFISPGYEIKLTRRKPSLEYMSIQLGCNFMMLMSDREPEYELYPFLNMGIHF